MNGIQEQKELRPYVRNARAGYGISLKRRVRQADRDKSRRDCAVCNHPAGDLIEQRILAGEPLTSILKEYSLPLFYHKNVCMEGRAWSEFQRPTKHDRPLKDVKTGWQYIVSERYKHHNVVLRHWLKYHPDTKNPLASRHESEHLSISLDKIRQPWPKDDHPTHKDPIPALFKTPPAITRSEWAKRINEGSSYPNNLTPDPNLYLPFPKIIGWEVSVPASKRNRVRHACAKPEYPSFSDKIYTPVTPQKAWPACAYCRGILNKVGRLLVTIQGGKEERAVSIYPVTAWKCWGRGAHSYSERPGCLVQFCPECGCFMRVGKNKRDVYCHACGLMADDVFDLIGDYAARKAARAVEAAEDHERKKDKLAEKYAKRLKVIEKFLRDEGVDVTGELAAVLFENRPKNPYVPRKTRNWKAAHIDQRIADYVLDPDTNMLVTEPCSMGDYLKPPKLLDVYNNNLDEYYDSITRFQLRASLKRMPERLTAKIDRRIDQILRHVSSRPTSNEYRNARIRELETTPRVQVTEQYFPESFIYKGTERKTLPRGRPHGRLWQKCMKYRAEKAKKVQKIALVEERPYMVGTQRKLIKFTLYNNNILFSGDEHNDHFESFFLSEYLKRLKDLPNCPGTKKECPRFRAKIEESFLNRFRRYQGFFRLPAPQEDHNGKVEYEYSGGA